MKNIGRIIKLATPYRRLISVVSVLILLQAFLGQATPLLIKSIVDIIQAQLVSPSNNLMQLYKLLFVVFLVNVIGIILETISDRLGDALSGRIGTFLIATFYEHILKLPQSYFDTTLSGKIVNQLTRGILSISEFIGTMTNFILPALLQSVLTIGLLMYYNFVIGLLSLLLFPFYVYVSYLSTKRWGKFEVQKNAIDDKYKSRIAEVIQNMKLVKTANSQQMEFSLIKKFNKSYIQIYDKQSFGYHLLNFVRNGVLEIVLIIIILITFHNTFTGAFSLGVMVLIIQLINQLRRPLFAMSFILERIQRAEAGAKEFFEILSLNATEKMTIKRLPEPSNEVTLKMDHVSFSYDSTPIIKDVSLEVLPHETIAVIGPSGAGKTTLINLLLKLYEPTSGTIYLNNQSYQDKTHAFIRSHFSYVFQDNELFSSTIMENVSYGHEVKKPVILKALKAAHADDFVKELPQGVDTDIGEKGVKLSGGQKQRIQIARAIVDPAPVLVLDEATSSLDAKSESLIQDGLLAVTKQKTVIIIAHRFSTLQHVNRIIVLDHGTVVDQGNPADLAVRPGIFKELLRYQVEGNQKLLAKYDLS
jgi:ATP-binding cassette subfamily B protein